MTDDIPLPETVEICQIKERIFKSKSSPAHSKSTFWRQRCGRTVASFHLADSGKSQTLRAHAQSTAHTSVYKDMMLATQPCASLFLYAMSTHASVLPSLGLCPHTQTRGGHCAQWRRAGEGTGVLAATPVAAPAVQPRHHQVWAASGPIRATLHGKAPKSASWSCILSWW